MRVHILPSILFIFLLNACNFKAESLEEKAKRIHKKVLTIDSHTDTPIRFTRSDFDPGKWHDVHETRSRVDFPRMKKGGLDAIFMAAFIGQGERTDSGNLKAKKRILQIFDSIDANVKRYPELVEIAYSSKDAYLIEKYGKRAIYIGIENGYGIGKKIKNIELFYNRGARYITLCHIKNNDICDSSTDSTEYNGLSSFGKDVVLEMNRLGMIIDVSHISDSSFYDVLEISKTPVIASHSNAREICNNPRNFTDDMLKAIAKNGGVVQCCILSAYVKEPLPNPERDSAFNMLRKKYNNFNNLTEKQYQQASKEWYATDKLFPQKLATVSDFVDHIDHIVKVAGINHVGIGTDFDGGGGLKDCMDVSEMGNITLELVKRGYSEKDIEKIWAGNFMRVFRGIEEFAK